MPLLESFVSEEAAGAAGCAENQYFHVGPHSELWLWEPASAQSGQYSNAASTGGFGGGFCLGVGDVGRGEKYEKIFCKRVAKHS